MAHATIGVIGGSGLYEIEGMTGIEEVTVKTPFGDPSDTITVGELGGMSVAFLPRHGRGHRINPTRLPVRANIYALKTLGVERLISVAAVGSLKEEIEPLHAVLPDQIIDRTRRVINTFFDDDIVAHVAFAEPFCPVMCQVLWQTAIDSGVKIHKGGTYLAMEGPQFSTRAESNLYRSWGASVIGMTAIPEAKLAREAEICYATLAFVTDYDCWNEDHETVSTEMIIDNLKRNVQAAKEIIKKAVTMMPAARDCGCATALSNSIITDPARIPGKVKKDLAPLIGKYIK